MPESKIKFTAVYERDGDWWMAYLEEWPAIHTQGKTKEDARENLKDAYQMMIQAMRDESARHEKNVIKEVLELAG